MELFQASGKHVVSISPSAASGRGNSRLSTTFIRPSTRIHIYDHLPLWHFSNTGQPSLYLQYNDGGNHPPSPFASVCERHSDRWRYPRVHLILCVSCIPTFGNRPRLSTAPSLRQILIFGSRCLRLWQEREIHTNWKVNGYLTLFHYLIILFVNRRSGITETWETDCYSCRQWNCMTRRGAS